MATRYIRIAQLASIPGRPGKLEVSPATVHRWVRAGTFPKPIKLGAAVTVWDCDQVDAYIAKCASAGKPVLVTPGADAQVAGPDVEGKQPIAAKTPKTPKTPKTHKTPKTLTPAEPPGPSVSCAVNATVVALNATVGDVTSARQPDLGQEGA